MLDTRKALLALGLLGTVSFAVAQHRPEVIYGDDDRLNLYQTQNPVLLNLAASTVGLFPASSVGEPREDGRHPLATSSYAEEYSLCPEEPFFDERNGAFCSGSLVAPDIIMTAGHCVRSESACKGTKFVFGFAITEKGKNPDSAGKDDVYSCQELLGREEVGNGADWALVRLDRPVKGKKVLKVNRNGDAPKGARMFVIGHPAGLPTKIAGGAVVRDPSPQGYFVANLDTYGGNSGSAVFNSSTGLIEGILVRGETDYTWKNGCRVSNVCTNDGCRGEDVTKISAVARRIPAPGSWRPPTPEGPVMPAIPQARLDSFGSLEFDGRRTALE